MKQVISGACRVPNRQGIERGRKKLGLSRSSGKKRMNEVYIASLARWDPQRKGLVELESAAEAGGEAVERKTRSSGWPCGRQEQIAE